MQKLIEQLKLRGYARKTVKLYPLLVRQFLKFINKEAKYATNKDFTDYLLYLDETKARNTVNIAKQAIQFYYDNVLGSKRFKHFKQFLHFLKFTFQR